MQELMKFEDVSELLGLDVRDEKRNRLLLGAVSESILLYLDRNLLLGIKTERIHSLEGTILPREYPIREIDALVDAQTDLPVSLSDTHTIRDLSQPDAYCQTLLHIQGTLDHELRITYRYGYALDEIPQLIREAVLCMMADRLCSYGKPLDEELMALERTRLESISAYKRNPLL